MNKICCITFLKSTKSHWVNFIWCPSKHLLVQSQQEKRSTSTSFWCLYSSLLLTLNREMFIWIASADYQTTSIYINFFQILNRCCQVHIQAILMLEIISIGMFQKKAIFCYFESMLYEKQLGLVRGISHSPRCFWYVKSLLFLICVYMIKGDNALTYPDPILPAWRDGYANADVPI